jgi:hypothetical protein
MDQSPGITIAGGSADAANLTYMDDITVVTRTSFGFHIAYIGRFLDKLIHHGFTLNLGMCRFLQMSIKLLGHTVGRAGVSPTPSYVAKVIEFERILPGVLEELRPADGQDAQVPGGLPARQQPYRAQGGVERSLRSRATRYLQSRSNARNAARWHTHASSGGFASSAMDLVPQEASADASNRSRTTATFDQSATRPAR